jgi:hypothetical protein
MFKVNVYVFGSMWVVKRDVQETYEGKTPQVLIMGKCNISKNKCQNFNLL